MKAMAMATPTPGHVASMTPEQLQAYRWEKEIDERNRPYTDEELDAMFPPGYKVLPPPAGMYLTIWYYYFFSVFLFNVLLTILDETKLRSY